MMESKDPSVGSLSGSVIFRASPFPSPRGVDMYPSECVLLLLSTCREEVVCYCGPLGPLLTHSSCITLKKVRALSRGSAATLRPHPTCHLCL